MTKNEATLYLYDKIPLTKLMGMEVMDFSNEKIAITAPLDINKNHKGTAFGGSIVTLLTTTCWLMVFKHFKELNKDCHIVIGRSNIEYKKPVTNDFAGICIIEKEKELELAKDFFIKKGKSKIELEAFIEENNEKLVTFKGVFFVYI